MSVHTFFFVYIERLVTGGKKYLCVCMIYDVKFRGMKRAFYIKNCQMNIKSLCYIVDAYCGVADKKKVQK